MHDILPAYVQPGLIVAGLLVGILVGLTGMGGGSLMTPMLIFLFGFNPAAAVGTDILHGAIFKSVGSWKHMRLGTVHLKLAALLAVGGVPASIAGVAMTSVVRAHWGADVLDILLKQVLGAMLVLIAAIMLVRTLVQARKRTAFPSDDVPMTLPAASKALAIGLGVGFIVGLTSVGSGTLVGVLLMLLFPLSARRIVGTDVLNAAIMLWSAGIAHLVAGNVDLAAVGMLLVGSVPGVIIGSHLVLRFNERPLRAAIGLIIALSGAKLLAAPDAIVAGGLCLVLGWLMVMIVRSFFRPPLAPVPVVNGPASPVSSAPRRVA